MKEKIFSMDLGSPISRICFYMKRNTEIMSYGNWNYRSKKRICNYNPRRGREIKRKKKYLKNIVTYIDTYLKYIAKLMAASPYRVSDIDHISEIYLYLLQEAINHYLNTCFQIRSRGDKTWNFNKLYKTNDWHVF